MIRNHNVKIIALVGLAGSGKSTAADYITQKGYPKVDFDNAVSEAIKHQNIEDTAENEKKFREELLKNNDENRIVNTISSEIHSLINAGQHRIVADGLYSWEEYKTLKHEFAGELTVVAIVASKRSRHRRLTNRPVHPLSQFEADQRDWYDIENLEKSGPIAIADHFIKNDKNEEELFQSINNLLLEIDFAN